MFSLQFSGGFVEDPESRRNHGSVGEVIDLPSQDLSNLVA